MGNRDNINIIDYFRVLIKNWRIIVSILVVAEILTLVITVKQPQIYESTATVLPINISEELEISTGSRLLEKEKSPTKLSASKDIPQIIIAFLKSQRMKRDAIIKFGPEDFSTNISKSKDKTISVTVSSKASNLSANIANFYVTNLEKINNELNIIEIKPFVILLDPATPAQQPSKPKVKLSLIIAGILALFIGIFLSVFIDFIESLKKA